MNSCAFNIVAICNGRQQCCFAAAIGPNNHSTGTSRDFEIDIGQNLLSRLDHYKLITEYRNCNTSIVYNYICYDCYLY